MSFRLVNLCQEVPRSIVLSTQTWLTRKSNLSIAWCCQCVLHFLYVFEPAYTLSWTRIQRIYWPGWHCSFVPGLSWKLSPHCNSVTCFQTLSFAILASNVSLNKRTIDKNSFVHIHRTVSLAILTITNAIWFSPTTKAGGMACPSM